MLNVDNKNISVDIETIVYDFKDYASRNGLNVFKDIRPTNNNIMVTCPFHKDGNESKPSFGIRTTTDKKDGRFAGDCNCFTCGWKGKIWNLISDVFKAEDDGSFGINYLINSYINNIYDTIQDIDLGLEEEIEKEVKYITEEELDRYRFVHPYMYKRKITDEVIEKFDIGYSKTEGCLTFPVWDENGRCVFVAKRSVRSKFFNYPSGSRKPVYLLNYIKKEKIKEVTVVESFINALTLWGWGIPAIALIGTGSSSQYEILNKSDITSFILAFDGDDAGRKGEREFRKHIKDKLIFTVTIPEGKDVNDLTKEEYEKLDKKFI